MATHSSNLVWEIPGTEKPGGLQSMRSQSRTRLSDLNDKKYDETKLPFFMLFLIQALPRLIPCKAGIHKRQAKSEEITVTLYSCLQLNLCILLDFELTVCQDKPCQVVTHKQYTGLIEYRKKLGRITRSQRKKSCLSALHHH